MASTTQFNSTTTSFADKYSFFDVYSKEDIENVKKWEEEEQQRRIADTVGEKQRHDNAILVSEAFSSIIRPTWFQKGSSYVIKLLGVARNAGNDILRSSQVKTINSKLQIAGQRGIATAQDVKHRVAVAGIKAQEASIETALDVKDVLQAKLGTAQDVAHQSIEKVQAKLGTAQGVAHQGIEKVQEVAKKIRGISLKWFGKVNKAFNNISTNTSLAFAVIEEENERVYRMNHEDEMYAMMNAFSVARLFKDMAPAFYRPTFEPNSYYGSKLLEGRERARRNLRDLHDRAAINNAKAVASIIEHKYRATTLPLAALVAAKAEVVEEIKVHKPIPATM